MPVFFLLPRLDSILSAIEVWCLAFNLSMLHGCQMSRAFIVNGKHSSLSSSMFPITKSNLCEGVVQYTLVKHAARIATGCISFQGILQPAITWISLGVKRTLLASNKSSGESAN